MINTSEDAKASLDKRSCVAKGIVTVAEKLCQQMYQQSGKRKSANMTPLAQ